MDISITEFRHRCLEIVRGVEKTGMTVTIKRYGKTIAQLGPKSDAGSSAKTKPWEELRAVGGKLLATPEESVLRDEDFAD